MTRRRSPLSIVILFLLAGCYVPDTPPLPSPGPEECTEEACGPAPGAPNVECEDGSIGGPICERNQDDECAWVIRECPRSNEECTAQECGPAPAAPNFLCDDGSVGGPGPCERNEDGVCGWTFRDCPS